MSSDSAGVPWKGRHFDDNSFATDDGSASPILLDALNRFATDHEASAVVDALTTVRLLIPLVARLGETGPSENGLLADKSSELAIVTVAGPDGRDVLPVFSSVDAMRRWNADARPVPAEAVRVALAAVSEGTELIVLDPGSTTEFAIRRPAVWAIAREISWTPSVADPDVHAAFAASIAEEPAILALSITPGDPAARLAAPEVLVTVSLRPGLDQSTLTALIARLQTSWSESPLIAERIDSLFLKLL